MPYTLLSDGTDRLHVYVPKFYNPNIWHAECFALVPGAVIHIPAREFLLQQGATAIKHPESLRNRVLCVLSLIRHS